MNATLRHGSEIDRAEWLGFLAHSPEAALYHHPAYLDMIVPGWEAIELRRDGRLLAVMPLHRKQKAGYTYALQPAFSQFWGICMAQEPSANDYKTYSHRRKVVKAVVEAIPADIKWFLQGFAPEFDYPHPFHWAGYSLRTRYTYRLGLEAGYAAVERGFGNDTRYDIRKAVGQHLAVQPSDDVDGLTRLVRANAASGKALLNTDEEALLPTLAKGLLATGLGRLHTVTDPTGEWHGAALVGSFAGKSMYLFSAQAPMHAGAGGMTLLLAEAIRSAASSDRIFDFEGSMIEGIEGFFRGFGGRPHPYLIIEKNALPLPVRWIRKLR